ncbi:glycosyl transferase [Virgisporangium aliadipatigenens]|uniref:Glycosyl transferase n=1 Tax=Virgisporangium aliadipatigenens TaxID=741659 RepID=A0A8J3YUS5_9ACTN|nr:glycosyltransferase family 4 protein [Virgisporangium aliadipatigenens]GIJ52294.1 glycosyl transferase [Virgisporangium aliadipatigenens]
MTVVEAVLPNDIDDPTAPSGGNHYDRRVLDGLADLGWSVREHAAHGAWPTPSDAERDDLAAIFDGFPDGAPVLVDGLIASVVPELFEKHAHRLRTAILVHLPHDSAAEARALAAAATVIATSEWTRRALLARYGLPASGVHAAAPGVDPAPLNAFSATGERLLCVAAVAPHKGHDLLVEALLDTRELPWECTCVGSVVRDADFAARVRFRALKNGLSAERLRFVGARTGPDLDAAYAAADLFVLPSRGETYGMVVTEALSRGIPVLAAETNGLPEALGTAPDGSTPGLLVPPDDPAALSRALRQWLTDTDLRDRLRRSAAGRRDTLTGWHVTAALVGRALATC